MRREENTISNLISYLCDIFDYRSKEMHINQKKVEKLLKKPGLYVL